MIGRRYWIIAIFSIFVPVPFVLHAFRRRNNDHVLVVATVMRRVLSIGLSDDLPIDRNYVYVQFLEVYLFFYIINVMFIIVRYSVDILDEREASIV